jgi:hypothetical protein
MHVGITMWCAFYGKDTQLSNVQAFLEVEFTRVWLDRNIFDKRERCIKWNLIFAFAFFIC